ncbi:MAG: Ald Xan dh protein [Chloroflexi bacterium]|nr:Ald Xan dh protein [Chloroflexota bacterium]
MTAPAIPRQSWLGKSVLRKEDSRFLTGRGQYADDLRIPGLLEAAMLRSPYAHALIKRIDYSRALEIPGVYGVITGADAMEHLKPGTAWTYPAGGSWYYMATDRARFAGEIVAIVAAEDRYIAEDALEAIEVEYEELPVVSDPERACDADQPVLHPGAPGGNEVLNRVWDFGDAETAFAQADVVVRERLVVHRHSSTPLEGLIAIASFDTVTEETTVWTNIGHLARFSSAVDSMRMDNADVRLIVPDVGGSFGLKVYVYQRCALMSVLSRKVGRPVKWVEDRIEHLGASNHGTGRVAWIELAAKRDGTMLGMKYRTLDDQGAYVALTEPFGPLLMLPTLAGPYRFKDLHVESHCVVTNKCPVAPNRGYGRIQPVFALERIVDRLARELNMDPAELRMKNLLAKEAFPYVTPTRFLYDSGDPSTQMRQLRGLLDYDRLRKEQAAARAQGRLLGIGLALSVEGGGTPPFDVATVLLGPDGRLMVQAPTIAQGQGHETTIAQIVGDRFDVDPQSIHVTVQLDTRSMTYSLGSGTYASRFSSTAGPAVHGAAKKLSDQLIQLAANLLDADPRYMDLRDGQIVTTEGPERGISLKEIAGKVNSTPNVFGLEADLSLQATYFWQWPPAPGTAVGRNALAGAAASAAGNRGTITYSFVCHGALVEVDPETGLVKVLKYASSEDCGKIINPMIVRGQILGGLINGLGWALTEDFVYDQNGQLLTGTFMDYLPARFTDIPPVELGHIECPTPFSPLGAKGVGEGGAIPPVACIANAVEDALYHLGGRIMDSHLTPELVLRAAQGLSAR